MCSMPRLANNGESQHFFPRNELPQTGRGMNIVPIWSSPGNKNYLTGTLLVSVLVVPTDGSFCDVWRVWLNKWHHSPDGSWHTTCFTDRHYCPKLLDMKRKLVQEDVLKWLMLWGLFNWRCSTIMWKREQQMSPSPAMLSDLVAEQRKVSHGHVCSERWTAGILPRKQAIHTWGLK